MPKLVQINATCNWGSTGRIAEQIGILALDNGWDCYIVHGARYVHDSRLKTIPVGTRREDTLHAIKSKLLGGHGLGSINATKHLVETLRSIKPDIVHLHNIHGYYVNYQILFDYLSRTDIPVVWTLHDCWTMTGHCTHFDKIGCERWRTGCYNCPQKKAQYGTLLLNNSKRNWILKKESFTSLHNLTIVPVSNWLGDIVKKSYLKDFRIKVINNGIDLKIFHPIKTNLREKLDIHADKTILLGVATDWDEEKGINEFIRLSINPQYQVVLIGLTAKQVKSMPKNIIALQHTSNQQELVEYYNIADMLVNPTYNDTFPTVNVEALACGTPVVTYRTGGSPEILSDETGLVVERGDYEALVHAIELCRKNTKSYYNNACVLRAQTNYNKDERFKDYIELYNSLLGTR